LKVKRFQEGVAYLVVSFKVNRSLMDIGFS
jgi:hypothetical protein